MEIFEKNGVWIIQNTQGINIFDHPENSFYQVKNPRLRPELDSWMRENCASTWSVVYNDGRLNLIMFSRPTAILFKLTWHGNPLIDDKQWIDGSAFYCPYIPLVTVNLCEEIQLDALGSPMSTKVKP